MSADRDSEDLGPSRGYAPKPYDEPDRDLTPEEIEEILEGNRHYIRRRFQTYYEPKVRRVRELYDAGDADEAYLLAICYIDGIAMWLRPDDRPNRKRFANLLHEHAGVERLRHIPTKHLRREWVHAFQSEAKLKRRVVEAGFALEEFLTEIEKVLSSDPVELLTLEEARTFFARRVGDTKTDLLMPELYRATNAGLLYKFYRNPLVHALGLQEVDIELPDGSTVPFGLWPVAPNVSFDEIHVALENVVAEAKSRSLSAALLFGSDQVGEL